MLSQCQPAIVAAIHAAMVLLIEPVRLPGRHHQAMDALAEFGITLLLGQVNRQRVPRLRGSQLSPPSAVWNTPAAEMPTQIWSVSLGMRHERMQDQPAAAGLPVRPRRMVAQAGDMLPGLAIVVAAEQPGRLARPA